MLARRLMSGARGGASFAPPPLVVTGPYATTDPHAVELLTQLHCHTTGSDGTYSPATVVSYYQSRGYDVLQITDHDVVTSQPAGITTAITGNELSPTTQHIIAIDSDYTRGGTTDAQTILDGIEADGGYSELAHPNWSIGLSYSEMAALTKYLGIEIHNGAVVNGAGLDPVTYPGYAVSQWDQLLTNVRRDVWGFAVDDLHVINALAAVDMGRVRVFAQSAAKAHVMAALVSGNFAADVANFGVTPSFPYRTSVGIELTCSGATRMEAWSSAGRIANISADTISYAFVGDEDYLRLVAVGDYTEPFSSLSDRWYGLEGTWAADGTLHNSTAGSASRLILRRHRQGDFSATWQAMHPGSGSDTTALMFNVLDATHWMMIRVGESVLSGFNDKLTISKTTDGTFSSPLASTAFVLTDDTWYSFAMDYVAATGTIRAKAWETGDTEPDWMVSYSETAWTHGGFGFRMTQDAEVDDLYIDGFETFYQPVAIG